MAEPRVPASVFKARCLALFDEIATTHRAVTVTKHGQPVARVVPIDSAAVVIGSVTLLADGTDEYFSTEAALRGDD